MALLGKIFVTVVWGVFLAGATARAGENAGPVVPEFWFAEPTSALLTAGQAAEMATSGMDVRPDDDSLAKGDSVTALVEHVDGAKRRQWLVLLLGSELSEADRALPPPAGMRLFSSTGNVIAFAGSREAIAIHVLGPVTVPGVGAKPSRRAPGDIWSGALVNGDFLRLGFAEGIATLLRLHAANGAAEDGQPGIGLSVGSTPFSEEIAAAGRVRAAMLGMTAEDERAIAASIPALMEFFGVAARTPGLKDILGTIVDIPFWSIAVRGGRMPAVDFESLWTTEPIDPTPWGIAEGTEVYTHAFVMRLNQHPALVVRMAVVAPRAPLVASAGIVGLAACRPDGKGAQLMIRLVAARPAQRTAVALTGTD